MKQSQTSRFADAAGFFGYLIGYALLCIPLLIWAIVGHASRAVFAKLGLRLA